MEAKRFFATQQQLYILSKLRDDFKYWNAQKRDLRRSSNKDLYGDLSTFYKGKAEGTLLAYRLIKQHFNSEEE